MPWHHMGVFAVIGSTCNFEPFHFIIVGVRVGGAIYGGGQNAFVGQVDVVVIYVVATLDVNTKSPEDNLLQALVTATFGFQGMSAGVNFTTKVLSILGFHSFTSS